MVHEVEEPTVVAESLGVRIDGKRGRVLAVEKRLRKLGTILSWLAMRPRASAKILERVVGHVTFVFLLRRPLLSIFSSVYAYIR